jgi:uncharacterized membrane protein HdeD (DUF308 family)
MNPSHDAATVNLHFGADSSAPGEPAPLPRWLVMFQGIVVLILGILLLVYPVQTLIIIITFLGVWWLISGLFTLFGIVSDRAGWGWKLLVGIVGIIAGILVLAYPLYSAIIIPTLLAIFVGVAGLIIGVVYLVQAFWGGGWGIGILGIVSIIFGFLLIAHPLIGVAVLVLIISIFTIIGGIVSIIFAVRMPGRTA